MKLLLTSILHRVAPNKSMLTLFRPLSYLGTTKKKKPPYSSLASMCSSSRPKMQGMFLLFDESLRVFNVHFLIVILQIFRMGHSSHAAFKYDMSRKKIEMFRDRSFIFNSGRIQIFKL